MHPMDLNILIRSMPARGGDLTLRAGVVADLSAVHELAEACAEVPSAAVRAP